jgi:cbb3-type cytochrome oxidase cytochrome c subunit
MARGDRFRESGRPATLGSTLAVHLYLIVWCKACRHQVEPALAEQVERYGAETVVADEGRP